MGLSHRGAHRGRHGGAERTSCAKRAQNERTTIARAVRCCSVRGSVCGWAVFCGCYHGGRAPIPPRRTCPHHHGGCGSACGWRLRPLPPSAAPSVAGAQPSHPLTLAPSHPLARPRTPSLAPCAFTAAVARRRVSLPLPSFGRYAAPRSLVGRLYLPVATALFPGAPAARLRPACFTARLGRAVALGN